MSRWEEVELCNELLRKITLMGGEMISTQSVTPTHDEVYVTTVVSCARDRSSIMRKA
jgi:hypothetical protein